jgi:hypothetical protein
MDTSSIILLGLLMIVIMAVAVFFLSKFLEYYSQATMDNMILCSLFLSKLSTDEWKFLEEIVDDIFVYSNKETKETLCRLFGKEVYNRTSQICFVEETIKGFLAANIITKEVVSYPQAAMCGNPNFFSTLPLWKRDQCDILLKNSEGIFIEGVSLPIVRVKILPKSESTGNTQSTERFYLVK